MSDLGDVDVTQISPEEFATLVGDVPDDQLGELLRAVGSQRVLDRVFDGMKDRFRPDRAGDLDTTVNFKIADEGAEHTYTVKIAGGKCSVQRGEATKPRVSLGTDLVTFAKLVTGHADGPQLFMRRKLKVSGDLMFATRIMSFFDRPKPG